MKILLRYWTKKDGVPKIRRGTNPRVLTQRLASLSFYKAFLKVTYPNINHEYPSEPHNEGYYFNPHDLKLAFRAFIEL
jgi:hypothetical protein